jgi:hypothetical protein
MTTRDLYNRIADLEEELKDKEERLEWELKIVIESRDNHYNTIKTYLNDNLFNRLKKAFKGKL